MRNLLIGIIAHRPVIDLRLTDSFLAAIPGLINQGWMPRISSVVGHSDLAGARNRVFSQAHVWGVDKLLFIDTDMSFADGTLERLVAHDVDLVGGAYRFKSEEEKYTVRTHPGQVQFVDPATGEYAPNGLIDAAGVATGLMCMSKNCISQIVETTDWYNDENIDGGKAWNAFEFSVIDHERFGEDLHFCKKWLGLGGKVWVDPWLTVHHHGDKSYSGRFADHLIECDKVVKKEHPLLSEVIMRTRANESSEIV